MSLIFNYYNSVIYAYLYDILLLLSQYTDLPYNNENRFVV